MLHGQLIPTGACVIRKPSQTKYTADMLRHTSVFGGFLRRRLALGGAWGGAYIAHDREYFVDMG